MESSKAFVQGGVLAIVFAFFALAAVVLAGPTPIRPGRLGWDIAASFVAVGAAMLVGFDLADRAPRLLRTSKSEATYDAWIEIGVMAASLAAAGLLASVALAAWSGWGPAATFPRAALVLGTLGILAALAPAAWFLRRRERRVREIEERLPDFLRDLSESYSAGMTGADAIRFAANGDYGRLTPEIRRAAMQVSWGTPFPEALRLLAERAHTPAIDRAVTLIIRAMQAGGNVRDVLAAAARDSRELKTLEAERRSEMALYAIVVYISFGVSLVITAALQGMLVPAMLSATQSAGAGVGPLPFAVGFTLNDFRGIFFDVALVQALGSGVMAGVIGEGSYGAGLKHATVLVAATLIALGLLV